MAMTLLVLAITPFHLCCKTDQQSSAHRPAALMASTAISTREPIRLFPSPRLSTVIKTPLSILDATCARFSDTGAVWLYEAPTNDHVNEEFVEKLKDSFVETLNAFPQWAGQLHWAPFRENGHHTERFNRSMLTYGSETDPGVQWTVVRHDYTIASFAPSGAASFSSGLWDAGDAFPQKDLISPDRLALYNLKDFNDRPAMSVQINAFACGGYGVGVKLAHQIADAQSMMVFMHKWAANARALFTGASSSAPSPSLFDEPVFDPQQLDARAAGDIDGEAADAEITPAARALPLHRFSWWDVGAPGYSPWLVASSQNCIPPAEVLAKTTVSPSTVAPWHTWDLARPVSWGLVHFTGEELLGLQRAAREEAGASSLQGGGGGGAAAAATISRTDALMAHLFQSITRARSRLARYNHSTDGKEMVYLNVSIDCRRRVARPLPETFLGSPLLMTHIGAPASALLGKRPPQRRSAAVAEKHVNEDQKEVQEEEDSAMALGDLALELRRTLTGFTPDKLAAVLHDAAYEVSPQRLWLGFMGTRHLIATSWQRLRAYEVDFEGRGGSKRPVYVHPIMERCDGTLVIADSMIQDGGVDVAVYLDKEAWGYLKDELGQN
jgi:hypothetical protein